MRCGTLKRIPALLFLLLFFLPAMPAQGDPPLLFGVLAYRPKAQSELQWQPLATYLSAELGRAVELTIYDYPELNAAMERQEVDVVLTNPGHFILLQHRYGLSAPLVTMIAQEAGKEFSSFGGVIFTRADNAAIKTLADLAGRRIAIVNKESLGGYLMQVFEMVAAGVAMPAEENLLLTGMPHDLVPEAVLSGRADVGFARTGLLEALAREGKIELDGIRVVNPQDFSSFPFLSSTRLYPEWPVAVTARVDVHLTHRLARALLALEPGDAASLAAGIHGFTPSANYRGVEDLLRRLRRPPFDVMPEFTLADLLRKYTYWVLAVSVLLVLVAVMSVRLALQKRALAKSEERFRTVADFAFDWEYWSGPEEELFYMSPSCESITGYALDEFTSDPGLLRRIVHPEDLPLMERHLHDVANREDGRLEFRIVRRDGGIRWIEHVCHPVWGSDGRFKGRRVSNRDSTERVRAEERLRENEERYRLLFDNAGDPIFIHDERGRMLAANQRAVERYGYTAAELMALTIDQVDAHEESRYAPERIARLMEQGHHSFETIHQRKDGSRIPTDVNSRRIVWEGIPAMISICRDISERKRAEADKAELEARHRQVQKAESLGRMAGAIAHHFNNMMAAVIGHLELAMMGPAKVTESMPNLAKAMTAAHRAAEVSRLMLTYLGQAPGRQEPLDLSAICRRGLFLLRETMPKEVEVEADFPSPGPAIEANEQQIQQVLTNLATNAWEALAKGESRIYLAVRTVGRMEIPTRHRFPPDWQPRDNVYACLEVRDCGHGMAEGDIDTIFDPFYTTKFTGRGLGLAVVLGIMRAHRGAITVESDVGHGSVFRVFFPVVAETPVRPVEEGVPARPVEEGVTILMVDDERIVRDMASAMLTHLGFTVLEAKDGMEAVEVFLQHRETIRCVLSDLSMPGMDGWQTLAALRKLSPGLPVILASGFNQAQVMAGDHPEMPQVFLGKPYRLDDLREAIRQALLAETRK